MSLSTRLRLTLCNVQVEVEALVIEGPKVETVMSQVKKLEVSVLVLGQKKPSPVMSWWVKSKQTSSHSSLGSFDLKFQDVDLSVYLFNDMVGFVQPVWEQQHRGVCGAVHSERGLLDSRSEEAEPRNGWLPNQHPMAEGFLALGLVSLYNANPSDVILAAASKRKAL